MTRVPKNVGILLDLGHLNISSNLLKFDRDNFIDNFLENMVTGFTKFIYQKIMVLKTNTKPYKKTAGNITY